MTWPGRERLEPLAACERAPRVALVHRQRDADVLDPMRACGLEPAGCLVDHGRDDARADVDRGRAEVRDGRSVLG
jgi:hypothetical protein